MALYDIYITQTLRIEIPDDVDIEDTELVMADIEEYIKKDIGAFIDGLEIEYADKVGK